MIVALPPQVLFTHIHLNMLIKESDLDYILRFIVGEGNGFNRLGNLSTVSSDQEKTAVNKNGQRAQKRGLLVESATGTDGIEGGNTALVWNWRCGTRAVFKRARNEQLRDQTRISVSVRLSFRERWDFQEKWPKVTREMSLHGSCGWLFFCRLSARASFDPNWQ